MSEIVGSATFTTVLSSMAMARAKHIVNRTMTFSLALSPSNPNNGTTDPFPVVSSRQDTA